MPILIDENDIENELENNFARRFPLEWTFERRVREFFRQMVRTEAMNLRMFGSTVSVDNYRQELQEILFDHYMRVMRTASRGFLNDIFQNYEIDDNALSTYEADKEDRITLHAYTTAAREAALITETNKHDLEDAITTTATLQAIAAENDVEFDYDEAFEDEFYDELSSRVTTIVDTETHGAFEAGKYLAALAFIASTDIEEDAIKKYWITTQDGRARDTHEDAHLQERNVDEPFDVGNVQLDYPGQVGKPPEEICNCGCISAYILNGQLIGQTEAIRPRAGTGAAISQLLR